MPIDPGRFNRQITLQSKSETRDSAGSVTTTWTTVSTPWAEREYMSGGRMYAAEVKHYDASRMYRIWYRAGVTTGMRLIDGSTTLEVVGVREVGTKETLELYVRTPDVSTP
jgi:SPP1 family predicted phage head-tail adaptor